MTSTATKKNVVVLKTHKKRSDFFRAEVRRQGLTIQQLADASGLCYGTVLNFLQLSGQTGKGSMWSKDPRTNTTVSIAQALGWTITFRAAKEVGEIEL